MQSSSPLGMPWWLWALIVIAVIAVAMRAISSSSKAKHRAEQERLAQAADATHEGAKTRHEGGA